MPLKIDNTEITDIKIDNTNLTRVTIDGVIVFQKKLSAPTTSHDSDTTINIKVDNPNNVAVTAYAATTSGGTTYSATISANSSAWITVGSWDTTYYIFLRASGWEDSDVVTGTAGSQPQLSAPVLSNNTDSTCDIQVTNNNSTSVTVHYSTTSGSSTYTDTIGANTSKWISVSSWGTTYYFYFTATGYKNSSIASGIAGNKLKSPTTTYNSDTICDIRVTNPNDVAVTAYAGTARYGTNYYVSIGANSTASLVVGGWDTNYFVFLRASGYVDSDCVTGSAGSQPQLSAPVTSHDSDSTCDIKVQNNNSVSVTVHYSTTSGRSDYTDTIGSNTYKWITVPNWSTTYYFYFSASGYLNSGVTSGTAGSKPMETLTSPSLTASSTTRDITVKNNNSTSVTVYYSTSSSSTGTSGGTISANSSKTITMSSWDTTYYFYFTASGWNNSSRSSARTPVYVAQKLKAPTTSHDSDAVCDITVTNPNDVDVTAYASTNYGGRTYSRTISANDYSWINVDYWDTTYYIFLSADGWEDSDIVTGTPGSDPSTPTSYYIRFKCYINEERGYVNIGSVQLDDYSSGLSSSLIDWESFYGSYYNTNEGQTVTKSGWVKYNGVNVGEWSFSATDSGGITGYQYSTVTFTL